VPLDPTPLLYAAGAGLYIGFGFALVGLALRHNPAQAARASSAARILVALTWPLVLAVLALLGIVRTLNRL